jgi:hemerythrin-like domain-containing protein
MAKALHRLREDHANILKLLQVLEHQVAAFQAEGELDRDIVGGVAEYFVTYPDHFHHPREDAIYRKIAARAPERAAALDGLLSEHVEISRRARHFAETVGYILQEAVLPKSRLVEAAVEFMALQRRHLKREERDFFPLAEEVLTAEDWAQVDAEIAHRDDPLFGPGGEGRLRTWARDIVNWDRMEAEG